MSSADLIVLQRHWSDCYLQSKRVGAFSFGCDVLINLIRLLRESKELQTLYLMCDVHTMGKAFVNALSSNTTLKSLIIRGGCGEGGIGSKGAYRLSAALKCNISVEYLCLDRNSLGNEGAKYIGRALGQSESIRNSSLRHNNIGCDGAKMLGSSLAGRDTLLYLNLSYNRVSDRGAIGLCSLISRRNSGLRKVDLSCNNIWREGGYRLYQSLESNSAIHLEWGGNYFSDDFELDQRFWKLHQCRASNSNDILEATLKSLGVASRQEEVGIMHNIRADADDFSDDDSEMETSGESTGGPPTKRARTEADPENSNGSSSTEGNDSEGSDLGSKRQSTESNTSEESGANNSLEDCKQKLVFTYDWQEKFEELAQLARDGGPVSEEAIAKIRNRV
ncbi:hypothetical protein ACHAXT_002782 [Thalassiosira profunda]